jgi:CBS domain-containing protein
MSETLVRDVMSARVRLVGADDSIKSAAEAMEADDVGAVVVVDEGRVRALVTDRDIVVRAIARGLDPRDTPV